jgi:hypothetical protein
MRQSENRMQKKERTEINRQEKIRKISDSEPQQE